MSKSDKETQGQEEDCFSNPSSSSHDDQVEKVESASAQRNEISVGVGDVLIKETSYQGHRNSHDALVSTTGPQGNRLPKALFPPKMDNEDNPEENEVFGANKHRASSSVTTYHGNAMKPVPTSAVHPTDSFFDFSGNDNDSDEGLERSHSEDEELPDGLLPESLKRTCSLSSQTSERSLNMSYEEPPAVQVSVVPIFENIRNEEIPPHRVSFSRFLCLECGIRLGCILILDCNHLILCDKCAGPILPRLTHCTKPGCGVRINDYIIVQYN